ADTRIVGFSRSAFEHAQWRASLAETTANFVGSDFESSAWQAFSELVYYAPGDIGRGEDFAGLAKSLSQLEGGAASVRVFYLATAPRFFESAITALGHACLA